MDSKEQMERKTVGRVERALPDNAYTRLGQAVSGYKNLPKDKLVAEGWLPSRAVDEVKKEKKENVVIDQQMPDRIELLETRIQAIEVRLQSIRG